MGDKSFSAIKGDYFCFLSISDNLLSSDPGYRITLEMTPEEFESLVSAVNNPKIIHGGAKEEAKT